MQSQLIPALGMLACVYLMLNLKAQTWIAFLIWNAIGLAIYFACGYRHSRLAREQA